MVSPSTATETQFPHGGSPGGPAHDAAKERWPVNCPARVPWGYSPRNRVVSDPLTFIQRISISLLWQPWFGHHKHCEYDPDRDRPGRQISIRSFRPRRQSSPRNQSGVANHSAAGRTCPRSGVRSASAASWHRAGCQGTSDYYSTGGIIARARHNVWRSWHRLFCLLSKTR